MTISANTVWEFQAASGAADNGGGFIWQSLTERATYKWTASGSGTNEYYCEAAAGGDPSLDDPGSVCTDGTFKLDSEGTMGSLSAGEWDYGDNDSLGYSTVYVRLDDGADPDTKPTFFVAKGSGVGIDYSQQAAAELSLTDLATSGVGVTTLTSATGGFTAAMVGNTVYLDNGTNLVDGWYQITAYTDTNTVTLDRAPDDAVGGVSAADGKVGGALDVMTDAFCAQVVAGNTLYVKNDGTMTITEAINCSATSDGTALLPVFLLGYNSTRGDNPTGDDRPQINLSSYSFYNADYWLTENFKMTGTASIAYYNLSYGYVKNCYFRNTSGTAGRYALYLGSHATALLCEARSDNGTGFGIGNQAKAAACYAHDCGTMGFLAYSSACYMFMCLSEHCETAGFDFDTRARCILINCTMYKCGIGIEGDSGCQSNVVVNNIIHSNTTGLDLVTLARDGLRDFNNWYNNTADILAAFDGSGLGPNSTTGDPGFVALLDDTDLACSDHTGPAYTVTSAAAKFVATMKAGHRFRIVDTGAGGHFVAGDYEISSYVSATEITLTEDPTDGTNETAGDWRYSDFTITSDDTEVYDKAAHPGLAGAIVDGN